MNVMFHKHKMPTLTPSGRLKYDRYLRPLDVWAIAFGCIVGWGSFVMPGTSFLPLAGPFGSLMALGVGALIMLVIGHNYSYLMKKFSGTGGTYSYTKAAFGKDHAFICSWFLSLSYVTIVFLNATALFVMARTVAGTALQFGFHYQFAGYDIYFGELLLSTVALVLAAMLFIGGKPLLQFMQTILALILCVGVIAVTAAALSKVGSIDIFSGFDTPKYKPMLGFVTIVLLAPWAYVGFDVPALETVHFKFSQKHTGRIIALSIIFGGITYSALTLLSMAKVPEGFASWQEYIADLGVLNGVTSVPTFYAGKTTMGLPGLAIITLTALAAILTGIIGAFRAMVRVLSTMAEDKILSERFQKTTYSIFFIMALTIMISLLGRNTLNWFVDLTSFGAIVAYGYTCAAAYRIAKTENNRKVMAVGLIGTIIAVSFVIVQLVPRLAALEAMGSEAFLMLSLWCLLGFVFYWRTIQRSALAEYSGMSVSGTVLFVLLVYSALMWIAKLLAGKDTIREVRASLTVSGIILLLIIFVGLMVMLYIQNVVRKKHEITEREKIRAVEASLAKSQFLFNMSHDIRTPMNAIIGYTNLARKEPSLEKVHEYLGKIDSSGKHLLTLINDILEMSRIENGVTELEYAPADLCFLFEEIGDLFAEQMKQKDLDFSVHDSQVQNRLVWCDTKNLNRVLLNVVSNAYKFTPAGGKITATLYESGSGDDGYGSYEFRVQDSGIGMSREFVDKMFTAFERERTSTDSGVEGTGLGLAITKRLVDLMGGTIEVLTSPGSGTQIIIRLKLKLATEEDLQKDSSPEDEEEVDFTGKRLLVVEDNAINMEIACMILIQQGFQVDTAENGKIALDMVSSSPPGTYDAILMDIQMPIMDGYAATRAIRALDNKELADIPILAMTANAFQEDVQAAKEAGMQAHVAKPVDVAVLIKELKTVLKKDS